MRNILLYSVITLFSNTVFAQDAKTLFKSAEKSIKLQQYKEAVELLNQVVEKDPHYKEVYITRAEAYIKLGKKEEAARDYERELIYQPKEEEIALKSGILYFEADKYEKSLELFKKVVEIKPNNLDALAYSCKAQLALKNYSAASGLANSLLSKRKNVGEYNYLLGLAQFGESKFDAAEISFENAHNIDQTNVPYLLKLAESRLKLNKAEPAFKAANDALRINVNSLEGYLLRGEANFKKNNFQDAITDYSKVIFSDANNIEAFSKRGLVYEKLGQFQNAIGDYAKIITLQPSNHNALMRKGLCLAELSRNKEATDDLEKAIELMGETADLAVAKKIAADKVYEINKEGDPPKVEYTSHKLSQDGKLIIKTSEQAILIKGKIVDASKIKELKINDNAVNFNQKNLNPSFEYKITDNNIEQFKISVTDIYNNKANITTEILRIEANPPQVNLMQPYASFNKEVFIDKTSGALMIEGNIKDESFIQSITIDGTFASFSTQELNPKFVANVDITNKNKFSIKVVDIHGNEAIETYTINVGAVSSDDGNVMGKTWVVFIENSKYSQFSSLEGPAKDISMMKGSLANYSVNNIIHKQNLSKDGFEKFFQLELRDLLRANNVKSLLIWYAGHGKFLNETGYWIPVDAKRDDEFSYYNINNVKAALQGYTSVDHHLLISDACESGPAFYLSMRAAGTKRSCNNINDTKFKSAQVFTSAGTELASDNSQFTKTFSRVLNENKDACIAIDDIVEKVTAVVEQNQRQKPKFGKIKTLDDENGTFFFIKK